MTVRPLTRAGLQAIPEGPAAEKLGTALLVLAVTDDVAAEIRPNLVQHLPVLHWHVFVLEDARNHSRNR